MRLLEAQAHQETGLVQFRGVNGEQGRTNGAHRRTQEMEDLGPDQYEDLNEHPDFLSADS